MSYATHVVDETQDPVVALTVQEIIAAATGTSIAQVSGAEITAGTATQLRSFSPADIAAIVDEHGATGSTMTGSEVAIAYDSIVGQTSAGDITAGTEIELQTFSVSNIVAIVAAHETTAGPDIAGATGKTTPVDADTFGVIDSADSNTLKGVTLTNLKAVLKTYFDTLYSPV